MSTHDLFDENSVHERVTKRLNRIKRLIVHLVLTVAVALLLPLATTHGLISHDLEALIPLVVFTFIGHAFWLIYQEAQDRIVQQEIEREQQRVASLVEAVKPKRAQHFSLNDDGELVEIPDESSEKAKRKDA